MTRPMKRPIGVVLALVASFAALGSAFGADTTELFGLGAVQKGTGGAGVASPQDASWVLLNPAALVDLERRLDLSLELLIIEGSAEPKGSPIASNPFAGELHDDAAFLVPSGGMVWPLKKGVLAVGAYGIQGDRFDYPRPRTTLALLYNADRRIKHEVAKVPIAYGYRFENGWALGAALVPALTRFRTDSLTLRLTPTKGENEYDYAVGLGYKLAVYKRWEKWSLGATYTSRTHIGHYDKYSDLLLWSFDLPEKWRAGIAYRPRPDLEFVLDYKRINWSDIGILGHTTIRGGLGLDDQDIIKAGLTWKASDRWTLRSGFSWGESSVGDGDVFGNVLSPALSELHLAAGFSYRLGERSTVHASFAHVLPEEKTDTGTGDLFSFLGRGTKIRYQEDSITVQYTLAF